MDYGGYVHIKPFLFIGHRESYQQHMAISWWNIHFSREDLLLRYGEVRGNVADLYPNLGGQIIAINNVIIGNKP